MRFTLLHLSDFHLEAGGTSPRYPGRYLGQTIVTQSLFDTVKDLVSKGLQLNAVVVSGDVAFGGKEEEYKIAQEYFDTFLQAIGLPRHRLYWVAGNHDVDRSQMPPVSIKMYAFKSQDEIAWVLNDHRVAPQFIHRKLDAFHRSANSSMGRITYEAGVFHFVDHISFETSNNAPPQKIAIAGLNSALFCGYDGDDEQKLAFGVEQATKAARQIALCEGLRIVVFHHPESCLHDADEVSINKLMQVADIVLTGHRHKTDYASVNNRHGQVVVVRAGAAFEIRDSENAFNIIDVDLETGKGCVHFYKYLPKDDKWAVNHDLTRGGKFKFHLKRLARNRTKTTASKDF